MKGLKIDAVVNLTSGLSIPKGSIVVISEGYADIKAENDDLIPCNVATLVYASLIKYNEGEANIPASSIKDFNPNFNNLQLTVANYETAPTQDLLIGVVAAYLETIYPENISIIYI